MAGALLILDTPEAIAAAKARRLASLRHPYIPAAVLAAHPWPPKRGRRRESSPATPSATKPTCEDTPAPPIAAPAYATPAADAAAPTPQPFTLEP
jgi:hypothetical protein